jgi:hypothetical protein
MLASHLDYVQDVSLARQRNVYETVRTRGMDVTVA